MYAVQNQQGIITPDLHEGHHFCSSNSDYETTDYHVETREDVKEHPRLSAPKLRQLSDDIEHYTTMREPRTYMQRKLAHKGASDSSEQSKEAELQRKTPRVNADIEEAIDGLLLPGRPKSPGSRSADSRYQSLPSNLSLASSDSNELGESPSQNPNFLRRASFRPELGQAESQLRRTLLLNSSSALELEDFESPASNRNIYQDAALRAQSGASESVEQTEGIVAHHPSYVNRRHGRIDWHRSTLFQSTGRQYGLRDHSEGYSSGHYVTYINQETTC